DPYGVRVPLTWRRGPGLKQAVLVVTVFRAAGARGVAQKTGEALRRVARRARGGRSADRVAAAVGRLRPPEGASRGVTKGTDGSAQRSGPGDERPREGPRAVPSAPARGGGGRGRGVPRRRARPP